ncbi:MAG: flagellar assembly protein FliH [Azonexus sp.]|nr:flagellar assembly protein FliH [Azonexus sp.]
MAGIIPREQLAAYQRWQANSFDPEGTAPAPATDNRPAGAQGDPLAATDTEIAETVAEGEFALNLPTAEDIEQIHEQARQEGYQAGFEEGRAAALAEAAGAREAESARIAELTAGFLQALASLEQDVGDQMLDLALEIASQVVRSTISCQREVLLPVIHEALQALPLHHGNIALHLHPEDAELLAESLRELTLQSGLHIAPDSQMPLGSCTLKAGHSEIDATLANRWKRVVEAIGANPDAWLIR